MRYVDPREGDQFAVDPTELHAVARAVRRPQELLDRPDLKANGNVVDVAAQTDAALNSVLNRRLRALVDLTGDDRRARTMVVGVRAELIAPGAMDFLSQALAVVEWGAGGAVLRAEVDVGPLGTVLVLHGSRLIVNVGASGTGNVRFTGHVGYGQASSPLPPQRARSAATIAPAATTDLAVPPFAFEVALLRTPQTQAYQWDMVRANGTIVASGLVGAGVGEERVRLTPDTSVVRITNLGAANLDFVKGLFLLGLS